MMITIKRGLILILLWICLAACGETTSFAPVMDINEIMANAASSGSNKPPSVQAAPLFQPIAPITPIAPIAPINRAVVKPTIIATQPTATVAATSLWIWPARGTIIRHFSSSNKGINIAGVMGEPIFAIRDGKVVYTGKGLRGYGNLIIIKHNTLYISAYAHNNLVLVKEGEWVKQGQKIAEMGKTGADKVMLHFEIRRAGKPINPLDLYKR